MPALIWRYALNLFGSVAAVARVTDTTKGTKYHEVWFICFRDALRSYPFLTQRTIGWTLTIIFIAFSIPIVIAFAHMDKDAISLACQTRNPGKVDCAFYIRLISYGALRLLNVLAAQGPRHRTLPLFVGAARNRSDALK